MRLSTIAFSVGIPVLVLAGAYLWHAPRCPSGARCVPVEVRTGYLTTTSQAPVVTKLYNYRPDHYPEIQDDRPLTFKFPAAYYSDGLSLKGGPVAIISLQIDGATWTPLSTTPEVLRSRAKRQGIPRDINLRRQIDIQIYANWLSPSIPSVQNLKDEKNFHHLKSGWLGDFDLYSYQPWQHQDKINLEPEYVDEIDVTQGGLFAVNVHSDTDRKVIDCRLTYACYIFLQYAGRNVSVFIGVKQLKDAKTIISNTISLLESHRKG